MKKKLFFGLIGLFVISGCSTTKSSLSETLKNKESASSTQEVVAENNTSGASALEVAQAAIGEVTAQDMKKTQVQEALKKAGYYEGEIDGKFGAQTKAAVKKFQEAEGLKVDGIAGPATKEKLLKYIS